MNIFELKSDYQPAGDQPTAIKSLVDGLENGLSAQTLLGVTGSGKTFTMANIISQTQRPAIILAPNRLVVAFEFKYIHIDKYFTLKIEF